MKKSVQRGLGKISPTSKVVQEYTARQVVKKVVLVMLASGILVMLEDSFFASFLLQFDNLREKDATEF